MSEKYYTVEQISQLLAIHPKTIQRYIREGKLHASKIGKSWRVTGHDLSVFTEAIGSRSPKTEIQHNTVSISSVIDIQIKDFDDSSRIVNSLTAALNCKPQEYGKSTMNVQHLEHEGKVRVTLWGNISFMQEIISFISAITEQTSDEGDNL